MDQTNRAELIATAEALGWMRADRAGHEVWYDPSGGHVSWADLPSAIDGAIDQLILDALPVTLSDAVALAKLGNPFQDVTRN